MSGGWIEPRKAIILARFMATIQARGSRAISKGAGTQAAIYRIAVAALYAFMSAFAVFTNVEISKETASAIFGVSSIALMTALYLADRWRAPPGKEVAAAFAHVPVGRSTFSLAFLVYSSWRFAASFAAFAAGSLPVIFAKTGAASAMAEAGALALNAALSIALAEFAFSLADRFVAERARVAFAAVFQGGAALLASYVLDIASSFRGTMEGWPSLLPGASTRNLLRAPDGSFLQVALPWFLPLAISLAGIALRGNRCSRVPIRKRDDLVLFRDEANRPESAATDLAKAQFVRDRGFRAALIERLGNSVSLFVFAMGMVSLRGTAGTPSLPVMLSLLAAGGIGIAIVAGAFSSCPEARWILAVSTNGPPLDLRSRYLSEYSYRVLLPFAAVMIAFTALAAGPLMAIALLPASIALPHAFALFAMAAAFPREPFSVDSRIPAEDSMIPLFAMLVVSAAAYSIMESFAFSFWPVFATSSATVAATWLAAFLASRAKKRPPRSGAAA